MADMEQLDCVVIGAGVVGLAIARALAKAGREVVILEAAKAIGTGISSRNSEVLHAGMHYVAGTLRAALCRRGNQMLRTFAEKYGVPCKPVGKLIVANSREEEIQLWSLLARGRINGIEDVRPLTAREAMSMEPQLSCLAALYSPSTAIIDGGALMLALLADAEAHGASLVLATKVEEGKATPDGVELRLSGAESLRCRARTVVIAAGLNSCQVARSLGLNRVPQEYWCKGNYFSLTGRMPFQRLIYPLPAEVGLGIHYTLDMAGRGRFGPDVEWIESPDYAVNPNRLESFRAAIRRYWPSLPAGALEPGMAGIRPKIHGPSEPQADFQVQDAATHGAQGVVALYGIESPGLTCCLALGDLVRNKICEG